MEIVLAIGLTSVVMYLLMTAVELYMLRVDSSRGRVESAQLARTLLDQMATDIAAMRLDPPPAATGGGGGGQQAGGGNQGGQSSFGAQGQQGGAGATGGTSGSGGSGINGAGGSNGSTAGSAMAPATTHGIFGTAEELRIDRAAPPNWARASRAVEPTESTSVIDLPRTVRYYVVDGTVESSQEFARRGVNVEEETAANVSGLYRELIPTASLSDDADPLASPATRDGARVELLAPEVVKLELHYFDGEQLVDEWDVVEDAGLPAGVEILLTIHEPDYGPSDEAERTSNRSGSQQYDDKNLVVYRRFVRIPKVTPPQPATALLPAGQQNGGGQPAQAVGQQIGNQNSGGQSGQGSQNGGGQQGGGNGN
jgi:hypothetical protein